MNYRLFVTIAMLFASLRVPADAHEKWFLDSHPYPLRFDLFFRPQPLLFVAFVLALTAAAFVLWRLREQRDFFPGPQAFGATPGGRTRVYGFVPLILAVHVSIPLLVAGTQGHLFSVNADLYGGVRAFVGLAEVGIALSLFYGGFTRVAAVLLAVLWVAGIPIVGLQTMLDNVMMLGFAVFFFVCGRGPWSVDSLIFPKLLPPEGDAKIGVPALRIALGVSIVVVAFTEKFANIPFALEFLKLYPLNFTGALGFGIPNETFILCAGSIELLVGIFLLLGLFTREIILLAWLPFNLTLAIFHWTELAGHVPIYGIMAVLLLWDPTRENLLLWREGLRPGSASE